MRDQLENGTMDIIVSQYTKRGEGVGGTSIILAGLTFPILTALAVQLINNQQYAVLAIIAILMWGTKFDLLVLLGTVIYFITMKYWIGVGLLTMYSIIRFISAHLGTRNIRRLLNTDKPMISPFEGAPDLQIILVFECFFLAFALLTQGWISVVSWCIFGIIVLAHFGRYWFRLHPRWSQIHQPLMFRYSACAARESFQAEKEQREYNFHAATRLLLKSVYPNKEDEEIEDIVNNAAYSMKSFSNRELMEQTIRKTNPSISQDTMLAALGNIEEYLNSDRGVKLIVRYAMAEVVESVFGIEERGRYLFEVFDGNV